MEPSRRSPLHSDAANQPSGNSNGQTIDGTAGSDGITTGNGNDAIIAVAAMTRRLLEMAKDLIQAGSGNDNVHGGTGSVRHLWQTQVMTSYLATQGKSALHGGAGADEIYGGESADTIFGDGGNDRPHRR